MSDILKYKYYKIQNAIWLQQTDDKRTNYGTNSEQYFLECYREYLRICEANNNYVKKVNDTIYKINYGGEFSKGGKENYNNKIAENLSKYLDICYKNYLE